MQESRRAVELGLKAFTAFFFSFFFLLPHVKCRQERAHAEIQFGGEVILARQFGLIGGFLPRLKKGVSVWMCLCEGVWIDVCVCGRLDGWVGSRWMELKSLKAGWWEIQETNNLVHLRWTLGESLMWTCVWEYMKKLLVKAVDYKSGCLLLLSPHQVK